MEHYRDDKGLHCSLEDVLGAETYRKLKSRVGRFRGIRGDIVHGAWAGYLKARGLTSELVLIQRIAEEALRGAMGLPLKGSVAELLVREKESKEEPRAR